MLRFLATARSLAGRPAVWSFALAFPRLFTGAALHRLALHALDGGDHAIALALFDRAAQVYRREVVVHALARLRVHELMARVLADDARGAGSRGAVTPEQRQALVLETERRLAKLDRIESLEPPFELVDARELLAVWWTTDRDLPAARAA